MLQKLKYLSYVCSKHRSPEAVLTSTNDLCFRVKIKNSYVYPCSPQFYNIEMGVRGCSLHRHVSMLNIHTYSPLKTLKSEMKKNDLRINIRTTKLLYLAFNLGILSPCGV